MIKIELDSIEKQNFLGIYEEKLDEILYDYCRYYCGASDENDVPEGAEEMYNKIKSIENLLNNELTNEYVYAILNSSYRLFKNRIYKSLPQAFGKLNEETLVDVIEDKFPGMITQFPNGEMNFPDITFDGIPMDFKAVKSEITEKHIKVTYNNAIDSIYEVEKRLDDFFTNNISSDLTSSFLIFTYYDEYEEPGKVRFLHFKIMPTLYCIMLNSKGELAVKSAGEADEEGNHYKIKNSNVCVKIPSVDRTNEDKVDLPSIEEKMLMLKNAISNIKEI